MDIVMRGSSMTGQESLASLAAGQERHFYQGYCPKTFLREIGSAKPQLRPRSASASLAASSMARVVTSFLSWSSSRISSKVTMAGSSPRWTWSAGGGELCASEVG